MSEGKQIGVVRLAVLVAVLVALVVSARGMAQSAPPAVAMGRLAAPGGGVVRALVVGVDHYGSVPTLRGAVADARDIEVALRRMGAQDVTSLIDDAVTRDRLLHELDGLAARSRAGDLVIITLAGHGAREAERVKGSSRDGSDEVFLMSGFDPKTASGGTEKILNHEFHHYIKALEARGAAVLFVADTCYGGGLAREVPLGAPALSYRQVQYRLVADDLKPVSSPAEAFLTELDFDRTAFLAAVDSNTKAPEILVGGAYRGALSYAVARVIEGAADEKHDGRITVRELFNYARRVVYQLSDERQSIVAVQSPSHDIDQDVVMTMVKHDPAEDKAAQVVSPTPVTAPPAPSRRPIRLAAKADPGDALSGLRPLLVPFEIVKADDAPDIVWDPASREAYGGPDKIALDVAADDLPGVVDRTAAVRDLKAIMIKSPLDVRLVPDASLHHDGGQVEVAVENAAGANLVLLDVTGIGKVQLLYPTTRHEPPLSGADFRVPFVVRDPYGADEVLAVASSGSLQPLVEALGELDGRRSAGRVAEVVGRYVPADTRFGLVGLFTGP